jgi:hypothetical protein
MSFTSKHNDYLDPDRHDLPVFEEPPTRWLSCPCQVDALMLEKEVRSAMQHIEAHPEKFSQSFVELFSQDYMPNGDFSHEAEEAGEWVYVEDDSFGGGWRKDAYAVNFYREDGVERIEIVTVDQDGNWDTIEVFDSECKWFRKTMAMQSCYYTLLQNNLYYLYVAQTGLDPLENTIGRKSPKEAHLKNLASDILELCLSVMKK